MSESSLTTALQKELQTLTSVFSSTDVVINDWSILDGPSENSPYILIENSDQFDTNNLQTDGTILWRIPFWIINRFIDWKTSLPSFQSYRDSVLTHLSHPGDFLDSSAVLAWGVRGFQNDGDVVGIYDRYTQNDSEALPVFHAQRILLLVEERV